MCDPNSLAALLPRIIDALDTVALRSGQALYVRHQLDEVRVSRWRSGNPQGLRLRDIESRGIESSALVYGGQLLSAVISDLTVDDAKALLNALVAFQMLGEDGQVQRSRIPLITEHVERLCISPTLTNPALWCTLLLAMQDLEESGQWDDAYRLGAERWHHRLQVPRRLSYMLRESISKSRQHLSAQGRRTALAAFCDPIGIELGEEGAETYERPAQRTANAQGFVGNGWELMKGSDNRYWQNPGLTQRIREGALAGSTVSIAPKDYQLPDEWKQFCWHALVRAIQAKGDLFEAPKLRFVGSEVPSFEGEQCRLQVTSYMRSVVTSSSVKYGFLTPTKESLELPLSDVKRCSNHLGVSSLVLTNDSKVVAIHQSDSNAEWGLKFVPPGGSVELEHHVPGGSLEDLVTEAITCEIEEECQVPRGKIASRILGLGLDLGRGFEPDFFGITKVDLSWEELEPRREPLYGGPFTALDLRLRSAAEFETSVDEALAEWSKHNSPSLMVCLTFLRSSYELVRSM